MKNTQAQLEALLFTAGSPVTKKNLCQLLLCSQEELNELLEQMRKDYAGRGVTVTETENQVALTTSPNLQKFLEKTKKESETVPLSQAAQETLAIIAYAGPITKMDLDFLRGVNTQYTLRRLSMRGLIQEKRERRDRQFSITVEFLNHLGIQKQSDLEDYEEVKQSVLKGIKDTKKKMEEQETR